MKALSPEVAGRLRALLKICALELEYLQRIDASLFAVPLDDATIRLLPQDDDLSVRVDAFVARFGRLQDTLGDKLLPVFLGVMGERSGAMLENLDRAEKLGLLKSADTWMALRKLRNRMVHEYVDDPAELASALLSAHENVFLLADAYREIRRQLVKTFDGLESP